MSNEQPADEADDALIVLAGHLKQLAGQNPGNIADLIKGGSRRAVLEKAVVGLPKKPRDEEVFAELLRIAGSNPEYFTKKGIPALRALTGAQKLEFSHYGILPPCSRWEVLK